MREIYPCGVAAREEFVSRRLAIRGGDCSRAMKGGTKTKSQLPQVCSMLRHRVVISSKHLI